MCLQKWERKERHDGHNYFGIDIMSRPVDEWIGSKDTTPIPRRVRIRIVDKQDVICGCGCGVKLGQCGEGIEFDHIKALVNGGENREKNIQALRTPCHLKKTKIDVAEKSVVRRKRAKHLGIETQKKPLPGGRNDKYKRKIGGGTVLRRD